MKRSPLHWFFLAVQFIMLAVSIPKVAMLFHAYDTETMGPLVGGVDLRSWLVGFAIDLTAMVTTWAALQKYETTGKRLSLLAPGFIIAVCSSLSVVANYEAAATLHPAQYAHVSIFEYPALLINPLLISAPPVIVLLLILIVPSVLARPRMKTAAEIALETEHEEARILADARLKEARVRAGARVRDARMTGLVDTASVLAKRAGVTLPSAPSAPPDELEVRIEQPSERVLPAPNARMTKAMWSAMSLKERVLESGLLTPQEVAEVLAISPAHARRLVKEVRTPDEETRVAGRTGVAYQALIDALYTRRSKDSFAQARKLESALGVRKKVRTLRVVPDTSEPLPVPATELELESEEETIG